MKNKITLKVLSLAAVLMPVALSSQSQLTLVEPPATQSQDIARVSSDGTNLYFTGREQGGSVFDVHLWKSDGVTSTKVKYLSNIQSNIVTSYFFPCNNKMFFFYSDGVSASGYEPWVTDGTTAGTNMILDINPGSANSVFSNGTASCFCYNNKAYFTANDGVNGVELWSSDGTAAGTAMVKDIKPGSGNSGISDIILYKNEMWFAASSNINNELWHSDGTAAGTIMVPNTTGLSAVSTGLVIMDTLLYFGGRDPNSVYGIWKSNGTTAGTSLIPNSHPTSPLSGIGTPVVNGNEMYYGYSYVTTAWQYQAYKTDGQTTTLLRDSLAFGAGFKVGNKVVFKGEITGSATTGEPWVTDGTPGGTYMLNPIVWGNAGFLRNVTQPYNNKIYFGTMNNTIWESDGSIAGTQQYSSGNGSVSDFAELNGTLYCNAANPSNSNRRELFKMGINIGIADHTTEKPFVVYPNPSNGRFAITSDIENAEIFNVLGEKILSLEATKSHTEIDMNNYSKGTYYIKLLISDRIYTDKIVVH